MKTFDPTKIEIPSFYSTEADKALFLATKEAYAIYRTLNTTFDREYFVTLWTADAVATMKAETARVLEDMPDLWSGFLFPGGAVAAAG